MDDKHRTARPDRSDPRDGANPRRCARRRIPSWRLLAELRSHEMTLADPSASEQERQEAERNHTRLEREVRHKARTARGDASAGISLHREIKSALGLLGERQLLGHARLDGRLYAVSVIDGRARLHDLGPLDDVNERIEAVTFSLHRLNRIQGSDESRLAAAEMLYAFADDLAEIVLPPIVAESLDPVVIVPTAILHDVPWGLLPPLAGRSVSVNPSVSIGATPSARCASGGTLLDGIEAGFVAGPGPTSPTSRSSTSRVGTSIRSCSSGRRRRWRRAPRCCRGPSSSTSPATARSAGTTRCSRRCTSPTARSTSTTSKVSRGFRSWSSSRRAASPTPRSFQGGSLLGLANAFTTLGAASVIAPLTPISDAASVTVMDRLHRELVAGADPAAALAAAT